jgi:SAM-dependent methyltransferase
MIVMEETIARTTHWEQVYRTKRADEVSWFQPEPAVSLDLIRRAVPDTSARIIDIGGGASTLVDALLRVGYSDVTVLDLSATALAQVRARLGGAAACVHWLDGDVLSAMLPEAGYDVWHDRAVFHFLTTDIERDMYIAQVRRAVRPGGYVLIATFAEDGPIKCSGLPVARYSADALHDEFGRTFELVESIREQHVTPTGATQPFVYCLCRFLPTASSRVA